MEDLFNGGHGHLKLIATADGCKLTVKLTGSLTSGGEMDEINEIDLVEKFLRRNCRRYDTLFLDVAELLYVDTYGMGALTELMKLATNVVILGLRTGLANSDLNVISWLATRGICAESPDQAIDRAA